MLQYNPTISGSLNITGSLIISNGMIGTVNGVDVQIFSSSISQVVTNIQTTTGSQSGRLTSIESFTSSTSARLGSIETISASNLSRINSIETITASNIARLNAVETITASNIARLTSLEITTGSLATTGSNTFIGTQTITGSLFISSDLIVQGSSSLQNITASAVSIGTNIVNLNTANPAIRYAGLVIGDSGSIGSSGSFFYDSVQDEMIFIHRGANTTVTSSVVLMGPQTYDNVGNETYPTSNYIQKGTGNEHLVDSCIIDDGTTTCVKNNLITTGTSCFGNSITAASTISIGGADQGYQLDVKKASTGDSTFDTIANFYKASTNGTQLLIRAKNSLIDLAGSYVIGGGGPNTGLSFSVSPSAGSPTEAIRIISNGNVGINAVSPNVKLEVCGTGLFTDNSVYVGGCGGQLRIVKSAASTPATMTIFGYDNLSVNQAAGAIDFDLQLTGICGHTAASIRALNADDNESSAHIAFYTATNTEVNKAGAVGTERLRITCDGRVGIGISSPAEKIHVFGSSGATSPRILIQSHDTANATAGLTLYGRDTSNVNKVSEIVTSGADLTISVNSTERMRITSCGNVVIGNTTAYGGLTVSDFTANDCNDSISLFYRGTSGNHESLIKFYDFRCQLNASIGNNLHDDTPSGQKARLVFKTSNNGTPTERMRIDACGKVGIGTNSPCSILHIVDTSANATTLTIGENGEVPTIKAGGANTDLRLEAVGAGGYLEFVTNGTNRFRTLGSGETTFTCQICTPGISITSNPIGVEYLIIAGGGGGGWDVGGGGGAGGVLNNSTGIWPGTYNIGIGAGGTGAVTGAPTMPNNGFNTYAIGLLAVGGGGGGNYSGGWGSGGGSGGGGAGYGATTNAGFGMKGQGFEGGCGLPVAGIGSTGGAGGGAGAAGASSINNLTGCVAGGTGIISTIIGEHRSYGCGGRGGGDSWSGNQAGRTNTGDGGDGAGIANSVNNGSNGGSGLTILKMRNTNSATFSGGLTTYTCTHICGYNIYVVTAGAGTVTIS